MSILQAKKYHEHHKQFIKSNKDVEKHNASHKKQKDDTFYELER